MTLFSGGKWCLLFSNYAGKSAGNLVGMVHRKLVIIGNSRKCLMNRYRLTGEVEKKR